MATLTPDLASPTDGDDIVLTCSSTSSDITSYEFFKDGTSLAAAASSNEYTISAATIDTHDGDYTCIASIDTVASDASSTLGVQCECCIPFINMLECFLSSFVNCLSSLHILFHNDIHLSLSTSS